MPCDTIQVSNVQFSLENTNVDLLKKALESLGWKVRTKGVGLYFTRGYYETGAFQDGKFTINTTDNITPKEEIMNEIKRAYSAQVVQHATSRFGWKVKKTAENKFQVIKKRN